MENDRKMNSEKTAKGKRDRGVHTLLQCMHTYICTYVSIKDLQGSSESQDSISDWESKFPMNL